VGRSQCGCCGEERWTAVSVGAVEMRGGPQSVWVLWRGEVGRSQCGCCGDERWAAVSVGAVARREISFGRT
jgi:hypothetical protein